MGRSRKLSIIRGGAQGRRLAPRSRWPLCSFRHALVVLAVATLPAPSAARCPDLALVLAIDASGSIRDSEFLLQLQGYAAAFRSVDVQRAIQSAGAVEVAVVLWADAEMPSQVMAFQDVSSPAAAERFADRISGTTRRVFGNTGIGRGLWTALDLLEHQMSCAPRRIVNVSGDGKETLMSRSRSPVTINAARQRAEAMAVTVNALAIQTEAKDLADWYRGNLLVGSGSFVMDISKLSSFAEAIETKLVREISIPMLAGRTAEPVPHFD